ncbi:hypothetical protein DIPPA_24633 [Diplonema papillatum]|nr:hypothetical protein DIPPA_24633 [Diplonema papillatum]
MLCTPTYVLVAEGTGGLKRAFDAQDIDSVGYSGVDTIVIRPETGCSEPPPLLRVIQNGAVAGSRASWRRRPRSSGRSTTRRARCPRMRC